MLRVIASFETPKLSVVDAFEMVTFVITQPRRQKSGVDVDFPDRNRKPVDAAWPSCPGPLPPAQHRLGPWQPIQTRVKLNQGVVRAGD